MDGVGDYTRLLATALAELGHDCSLLALADHHVKKPSTCDSGDGYTILPSLRLPAREGWPARLRQAMSFREGVAPDWVSWQFVIYGFDPRGLSFGLGRRLREVSGRCKNHIMFHELWIGEMEGISMKQKLIGRLQKQIIKDVLQKLRPSVIHTHTPLYQYLIKRLGYPSKMLPLFGNIPLARPRPDWLKEKWPEGGGALSGKANRAKWWILVLFGSIHPEWDATDFREKLLEAARRAGKRCLLISIGRPGGHGERVLRALRQFEGTNWGVLSLGPQAEEDISQCLLSADFGVSAVPPENVFKSGTAAAMTEHGLPILVSRPAAKYRNCPPEILLEGMPNVIRHFDLVAIKRSPAHSLLPGVAAQFIADLERA